jgi:hypothetical protein
MTKLCKIWIEQCQTARGIEDEFGVPRALAYLIGRVARSSNWDELAEWFK